MILYSQFCISGLRDFDSVLGQISQFFIQLCGRLNMVLHYHDTCNVRLCRLGLTKMEDCKPWTLPCIQMMVIRQSLDAQ